MVQILTTRNKMARTRERHKVTALISDGIHTTPAIFAPMMDIETRTSNFRDFALLRIMDSEVIRKGVL